MAKSSRASREVDPSGARLRARSQMGRPRAGAQCEAHRVYAKNFEPHLQPRACRECAKAASRKSLSAGRLDERGKPQLHTRVQGPILIDTTSPQKRRNIPHRMARLQRRFRPRPAARAYQAPSTRKRSRPAFLPDSMSAKACGASSILVPLRDELIRLQPPGPVEASIRGNRCAARTAEVTACSVPSRTRGCSLHETVSVPRETPDDGLGAAADRPYAVPARSPRRTHSESG